MEQENEFKRILTGKEYNQLMSIFKSITPAACEGTNFISHLAKKDISQFPIGNYFTFGIAEYFILIL